MQSFMNLMQNMQPVQNLFPPGSSIPGISPCGFTIQISGANLGDLENGFDIESILRANGLGMFGDDDDVERLEPMNIDEIMGREYTYTPDTPPRVEIIDESEELDVVVDDSFSIEDVPVEELELDTDEQVCVSPVANDPQQLELSESGDLELSSDDEELLMPQAHRSFVPPQLQIHPSAPPTKVLCPESKITLSVGGKRFHIRKNLLEKLGIHYGKLHTTYTPGESPTYFLDRDPYYFSKIIELIRLYGVKAEDLTHAIDECSEQLVSEMCYYKLIDSKLSPQPKAKLKRLVSFPSRHDDLIKLAVKEHMFTVSSSTLSRSAYFDAKLKLSRSKEFVLTDTDPKVFRYVLNLLRTGHLYSISPSITKALDHYGIEYELLEQRRIHQRILMHNPPHGSESIQHQLVSYARTNSHSQAHTPTPITSYNSLSTSSPIAFDSEIEFDLTSNISTTAYGIKDIVLQIDIPVLKPTEPYSYADLFEYKLIDTIRLEVTSSKGQTHTITQANPALLYLYPLIYKSNPQDHHNIVLGQQSSSKLWYNNSLIDIHRITLPLYLFDHPSVFLPIRLLAQTGSKAKLIVSTTGSKHLFKSRTKDIPLLNISAHITYLNCLDPAFSVAREVGIIQDRGLAALSLPDPSIPSLPITRTHPIVIPITPSEHPIYDTVNVPLTSFGTIKDLFFTIASRDAAAKGTIGVYIDDLIELEILQLVIDPTTLIKSLRVHSRLESSMLNGYLPLQQLGHSLPSGIYYYSFSSDPLSPQVQGGLCGSDYVARFKVKKQCGCIQLFVREYRRD